MSQHDYVLDNANGATYRADGNALYEAMATLNSGATAPTTTFSNMWWADTSTNLLKRRNNANTAWISVMDLATGLIIGIDVQAYDADTTKNDIANVFTDIQDLSALGMYIGGTAGGNIFNNFLRNATFTPDFDFSTPGDLSVAYGTQLGRYIIIGDALLYHIELTCTPTFTTSSGQLEIGPLPNTPNRDAEAPMSGLLSGITFPTGRTQIGARASSSDAKVRLVTNGSNVNAAFINAANVTSGNTYTFLIDGQIEL